ncbi:MAG: spore coat protein U domain-containing protein [Pseudomonadota bacterium]
MKKSMRALLLLSLLAPALPTATAAVTTAIMVNTVVVVGVCAISATGFATTYDPTGANASSNQDATGSVSTLCTNGATATITLGQGLNAAPGSTDAVPLRRLSSGGGSPTYLNYSLSQDASRTVAWGNTLATGVLVNGTGNLAPVTAYARLPSAQVNATVGTYTDTVIATVTF